MQDFAFGVVAAPGETQRFKSESKPPPLASVELLGLSGGSAFDASVARGTALARGTLYARYLVEAPPNVCSPTYLAGAAKAIADQFPDTMKLQVLERDECEAMGMGCYLGVAMVRCHQLNSELLSCLSHNASATVGARHAQASGKRSALQHRSRHR